MYIYSIFIYIFIYAGHCNTALNWCSYRESVLTTSVFVFTFKPLLPVTKNLLTSNPRACSLYLIYALFHPLSVKGSGSLYVLLFNFLELSGSAWQRKSETTSHTHPH